MYNHINSVRDSVLMQFIKQENQIPRILNDHFSINVPMDAKPEYFDAGNAFVKDGIQYCLCAQVEDLLVVVMEENSSADLAGNALVVAGECLAYHTRTAGRFLVPLFVVLDMDGEHTAQCGARVETPFSDYTNMFHMELNCISMKSYMVPEAPLWYYSDFIQQVKRKMRKPHYQTAEQAVREVVASNDSMTWFFQQKPERIAQLAKEMDDSDD